MQIGFSNAEGLTAAKLEVERAFNLCIADLEDSFARLEDKARVALSLRFSMVDNYNYNESELVSESESDSDSSHDSDNLDDTHPEQSLYQAASPTEEDILNLFSPSDDHPSPIEANG
ncbi:hypothetical protein NHQ30_008798 [Ciborinia camelliae]|nr:hypothetical protein NHQ30_008798 [Ciborinia camelliae]